MSICAASANECRPIFIEVHGMIFTSACAYIMCDMVAMNIVGSLNISS